MNDARQQDHPATAEKPRRGKFRRRLRMAVRCGVFAAAIVLLLPLAPWGWSTMVVPAASVFVTLASLIATRSVGAAAVIGLPIALVVLLRKRWFCRWMCPMGLMTECVGRVSPLSHKRCRRVPPLGKAVVLLSMAAACVGYPLLLWLDPLAIFSGLFGLGHATGGSAAKVSVMIFGGIMVLSFVLPGAWCLKLCPLGATQEFLAVPRKLLLRWRKGAGDRDDSPTDAETKSDPGGPIHRRSAMEKIAGSAFAGLGAMLGCEAHLQGTGSDASVLRPPGAAPSGLFPQLCLRCGNCVRACPTKIIRTDRQSGSLVGWLAPVVVFETDYCREDCNDCMQVCPSGAIARSDLADKPSARIGLAHIDMDRCIMAMGPECRAMCMNSCPYEAIVMHEWTFEDDRRYPIVETEKCPGCGACVLACTPMNAIQVRPLLPSPDSHGAPLPGGKGRTETL